MRRRLQHILWVVVSVSSLGVFLLAPPGGSLRPLAAAEIPQHYRVVPERSTASYRIREQLAGINFPSEAVGTTQAVTGTIALDDQGQVRPSDSRMTIDLRTGLGHMTVDTCGKKFLLTFHTTFKTHRIRAEVPRSSKESWCPNMAIRLAWFLAGRR